MMNSDKTVGPYYRPTKSDLPRHARKLTRPEVLHIQSQRLQKAPTNKSWPYEYGNLILSGAATVTGIALLIRMRRSFKLGGRGLPTSLFPTVGMTFAPNFLIMNMSVTQEILTGQVNRCPECMQVRSALLQTATGIGYPFLIAPFITYAMFKKFQTIPSPAFYPLKEFGASFGKYFFRPVVPILAASAVAQVALAVFITRKQYESFVWLMNQEDGLVHTG